MTPKLEVRLWEARGAGVILACPTGVVYQNQVGGHACLQRQLEGAYAPLDGELTSLEDTLVRHFAAPRASRALQAQDADLIDAALDRAHPIGRQVRVDRARLGDSCEAWVWVEVRAPTAGDRFPLLQFAGERLSGVLTWANSD